MADRIPLSEQLGEVQRELMVRLRVYPRWILKGTINSKDADVRILRLKAVEATLLGLIKQGELQL